MSNDTSAVTKKEPGVLHWVMYGLYYPAVLGTGIVETLHHANANSPAIFVALTAGAFFSLSFALALGREHSYPVGPFLLDVVEVVCMFLCFACLRYIDAPEGLAPYLS